MEPFDYLVQRFSKTLQNANLAKNLTIENLEKINFLIMNFVQQFLIINSRAWFGSFKKIGSWNAKIASLFEKVTPPPLLGGHPPIDSWTACNLLKIYINDAWNANEKPFLVGKFLFFKEVQVLHLVRHLDFLNTMRIAEFNLRNEEL